MSLAWKGESQTGAKMPSSPELMGSTRPPSVTQNVSFSGEKLISSSALEAVSGGSVHYGPEIQSGSNGGGGVCHRRLSSSGLPAKGKYTQGNQGFGDGGELLSQLPCRIAVRAKSLSLSLSLYLLLGRIIES